eukprot:3381675-Rhodomonas_salina.3
MADQTQETTSCTLEGNLGRGEKSSEEQHSPVPDGRQAAGDKPHSLPAQQHTRYQYMTPRREDSHCYRRVSDEHCVRYLVLEVEALCGSVHSHSERPDTIQAMSALSTTQYARSLILPLAVGAAYHVARRLTQPYTIAYHVAYYNRTPEIALSV